jgi:tetratricopeptide (TPR) repeat protein
MAAAPLLSRLGSLFRRRSAPQASAAPAAPAAPAAAPAPESSTSMGGAGASASTVLADPIVAQANQELAAAQAQPVPNEDEALQAEQHTAWAAYDFERCIVIFSRLLELHPNDAGYKEKLVTSYFNRGKQYEAQGDERRASQLYYSALSLDPGFSPAQEAAEAFLQKVEGEGGAG